MLIKNKTVKAMSKNLMKCIIGGAGVNCTATISCGDSNLTCAGENGRSPSDGGSMGCNAYENSPGNSTAMCFYRSGDTNNWASTVVSCRNGVPSYSFSSAI